MKRSWMNIIGLMLSALIAGTTSAAAQPATSLRVLIHANTSLAEDDAQLCAVPNVAWAAVKDVHKVTILVDASAVTTVTKGFGWFRRFMGSDTTALDRAGLPERERKSLAEQMGVPIEKVPHNYGEYFDFLKRTGVEIYGNR